jgi:hypothetical protein
VITQTSPGMGHKMIGEPSTNGQTLVKYSQTEDAILRQIGFGGI